MKALSLIQPWAQLIVDGRKTIETRSWKTSYRGPLAIHASTKVDRDAAHRFYLKDMGFNLNYVQRVAFHYLRTFFPSAVVGTATLYDCVQFPSLKALPDDYGDFTPGRYGWLLKDIVKFEKPVPAKGHLGLWEWIQ